MSLRGLYSQSEATVSRRNDSPWWIGPRSVMCIWGAAVLCREGWETPGCTSCMLLTWCDWLPLLEWLLPENRQNGGLFNRKFDMRMENIVDVYTFFNTISCNYHIHYTVLFIRSLGFHEDLNSRNRILFILVNQFILLNPFWFISAITQWYLINSDVSNNNQMF